MVSEGTGRLFRRKDGKFLIYLPKDVCEDSQFPFLLREGKEVSIHLKITFRSRPTKQIIAEELPPETPN